jgi:hypothetical protein
MAKAPQILTSNRLRDGEVVYWREGAWVGALTDAQIFPEDGAAKAALAEADAFVRDRIVVNPYLFDVRVDGAGIIPVEEREIIRAAGPTVRLDLGKQARHVSV